MACIFTRIGVITRGEARIWGAHAPRVLAMTPSSSRTFSSKGAAAFRCRAKVGFGEAPKPAREGACAPRTLLVLLFFQVIQCTRSSPRKVWPYVTRIS